MSRRRTLRGRIRREAPPDQAGDQIVEIDPGELSGIFAAPGWLRDLGIACWLLVGVAAALAGAVWLLTVTQTIVLPVITAGIIAAVAGPLVDRLHRRRIPRAAGAAAVFLGLLLVGLAVGAMILAGISSQADVLSARLTDASATIKDWAVDLDIGERTANDAESEARSSVSGGLDAMLSGVAGGIDKLASLVVFLSFTAISLFFLLKDSPAIGAWVESHLGVPRDLGHTILARVSASLRSYFLGVTIVAAWSALIVGAGALVLGVPLAGTIAVVTFAGGYIPYIGAWTAGAFAVLIALGGEGPEIALALAVVVLLANGILQQLVQPVAYGAALGLHPLAVLIVTIGAGALFGTIGLVLAAPLTSAAVGIWSDLAAARAAEGAEPEAGLSPPPAPAA